MHKVEILGFHPQVVLADRRIDDGMGKFIAKQIITLLIAAGSFIKGARVNVLGLTFKENCGDLRNSKAIDIIHELQSYGGEISAPDPQVESEEAVHGYGVHLVPWNELPRADAIVAGVSRREFVSLSPEEIGKQLVKGGAFIDLKAAFPAAALKQHGFRVRRHRAWRC